MQLKSLILGVGLTLGLAGSAAAQTILNGSNVDEIAALAKTYGTATVATASNGDPKIDGKIDGIPYVVYFKNCSGGADCKDVNFYAGFLDTKPDLETINAWNRDKRFGKAYLDSDLDAVIEWDVDLEYGVTQDAMDAAFSLWSLLLGEYVTYVGAR